MGWSCTRDASHTLEKWSAYCLKQTGSQNEFEVKGRRYFVETSRREHLDGSVTGSIFRMLTPTTCRPLGSFRIESDGRVSRAPAALKRAATELTVEDARRALGWRSVR